MSGKYINRLPRGMPADQTRALSDVFQDLHRDATQYQASGTGAVARTAQAKLGDVVAINDYGPFADGATNDATANNNAMARAQALGGGIVYYAPGLYRINHALGAASDGTTFVVRRGGTHYIDPTFPTTLRQQNRSAYRADMAIANGEGASGLHVFAFNGNPINSTLQNLSTIITPDTCAINAWGVRGSQGTAGTNPLIPGNVGAWFENNTNLVWALEVDCNNEGATGSEGDDNRGVGICLNTGSTYSPDTAISVRRQAGAGTGPGWLRGISIRGARNTGIEIKAMSPVTFPSVSPAAPGTIQALQVGVSNDAFNRWVVNESGAQSWGSGAADADLITQRAAARTFGVVSVDTTSGQVWVGSTRNTAGATGQIRALGKDSLNADKLYGSIIGNIVSATAGAETGSWQFWTRNSGTESQQVTIGNGVAVGNPTGGEKGLGTINLAGDIYKNNTAYTNPDYVFELAYCGEIVKFKDNPGANDYALMTLDEIEAYTREHLQLPRISRAMGAFERSDAILEKVEEIYLHLFNHHKQLQKLAA